MPGRVTVPPKEARKREIAKWHGGTVPHGTTVTL